MNVEPVILAAALGIGFGAFAYRMRSSASRLAVFLFVLWVFQSATQQTWRGFQKGGDFDELLYVAAIRLIFGACAVAVLWVLNRRLSRQPRL